MGRRKRKSANKRRYPHSLCPVCQISYRSSIVLIPRCSSCLVRSQNAICDSCLHKYIFTTISQDITSQIICPEQGCNSKLTNATIQAALDSFNHHDLWEEYALKSRWRGTSKQWIERFAARCPGCLAPIEKNGGCNQVVCRQCHRAFNWQLAKNPNVNSFGGNPYGGGFPPQFPGSVPQQGFGQYGGGGGAGFFNGGAPFQGGNAFSGASPFPPPSGFPSSSIGGQFGQGFGFPSPPIGGQFGQGVGGFPSPPIGGQFGQGVGGFPSGPGGFGYQQSPYAPQFLPGQQPPFGNPNYFGSGSYGRPRSRRSSRHRSKSRRRQTSSSSSSDDEDYNRGSPYGGRGNPYVNVQPFPNIAPRSPRGGSPVIPPRQPAW